MSDTLTYEIVPRRTLKCLVALVHSSKLILFCLIIRKLNPQDTVSVIAYIYGNSGNFVSPWSTLSVMNHNEGLISIVYEVV